MMKRWRGIIFIFIFVSCMQTIAYPQSSRLNDTEKKINYYVAILNFEPKSANITKEQAEMLTNSFINAFQKRKRYKIMTRTQIKDILDEQMLQKSEHCSDSGCAVEVGKILGVGKIIVGQVGKFEDTFIIILHLVNVETSEEINTCERRFTGKMDKFFDFMPELANEITGMFSGISSPSPTPSVIPSPAATQTQKENITPIPETVQTLSLSPKSVQSQQANSPQKNITIDLGNKISLEMIYIPGGSFIMGTNEGEIDELPAHEVTLDDFWIAKCETTQAQWQQIMGSNTSNNKGNDLPVERITWYEAMEFCGRLSEKTGFKVSLPTEAQREYACRAGSTGRFFFGEKDPELDEYAWFAWNSDGKTHAVGQKKPNPWGLYDVYGNVTELCLDWYHGNYYQAPVKGESWDVPKGVAKVVRGGWFGDQPWYCRSVDRYYQNPNEKDNVVGFRIVMKK